MVVPIVSRKVLLLDFEMGDSTCIQRNERVPLLSRNESVFRTVIRAEIKIFSALSNLRQAENMLCKIISILFRIL